jgi:hypothetical protein
VQVLANLKQLEIKNYTTPWQAPLGLREPVELAGCCAHLESRPASSDSCEIVSALVNLSARWGLLRPDTSKRHATSKRSLIWCIIKAVKVACSSILGARVHFLPLPTPRVLCLRIDRVYRALNEKGQFWGESLSFGPKWLEIFFYSEPESACSVQ